MLFACLLATAGGAAYAAKPRQALFKVTLTAALTKTWTFTRIESSEADCTRTTRGAGRWEAKLSTRSAGSVRAIAAGAGQGSLLRRDAQNAHGRRCPLWDDDDHGHGPAGL